MKGVDQPDGSKPVFEQPLRLLLVAHSISATTCSEPYCAFKFAQSLSQRHEVTVLAYRLGDETQDELQKGLPRARVVTWPTPNWRQHIEKMDRLMVLSYVPLYWRVRAWIKRAIARGERFDIAHQLTPQAARYPTPLTATKVPYVLGPVAGSLATPPGFQREVAASAPALTWLRALDAARLRYDPWLRHTYRNASTVLAAAPYVVSNLAPVRNPQIEMMHELGVDALPSPDVSARKQRIQLLHVGRAVRTKGLLDLIRALSHLRDLDIELTSLGSGPELDRCKAEVSRLGLADRVDLIGEVPRAEVEAYYRRSDIFVFPSFREPVGTVLFEAMSHGLPVVTVNYGGPGAVVDDTCGIKLDLTTPNALAWDLAQAVRSLVADRDWRDRLGVGAKAKVLNEGLWDKKASQLTNLYREVLQRSKEPNECVLP